MHGDSFFFLYLFERAMLAERERFLVARAGPVLSDERHDRGMAQVDYVCHISIVPALHRAHALLLCWLSLPISYHISLCSRPAASSSSVVLENQIKSNQMKQLVGDSFIQG